ncbi:MAG TPA: asparagine synthase-related protein, partial [Thermoanaerobaculia bacterium]|nr:asparagine synthase-related protein [Thermoanaerobaculia bacterium]
LAPSLHRRYRGARDVLRGLDGTGAGAPWSREWLRLHADEPPPALPAARRDLLTRKLYADALDGNLQELLRYGDRNSMAWSREVRQPFLDHRLGEFVFALGPQAKISGGQSKVVLRDAMRALVPDEILGRQDKLGYQPPFASWLGGPLSSWLSERADDLHHEIRRRMVGDPIPGDRSVGLQRDLNETFRLVVLSECLEQMDRVGSERPCLSPESWNRRTATSR